MNNLYNLTAKQIGTDLVLEYWETPEPIYEHRYREWYYTKKTAKFHPNSIEDVYKFIFNNNSWGFFINDGCKCDSLLDRIEIVDGYAILKPIESEETQDQLWKSALTLIQKIIFNKQLNNEPLTFEEIESKFTIKRK